ncbi:MAG: GumC family protein [Planctomycetaceae bacterium]|nr:GumC family protein [Planctomycetales bacterium]MCB9872898.1 GumC family protein [Planctomycetaceae bacterium]MCB9941480.1 GumC family protein [Planctomycetaceae bacterium]
MFSDNEKPISLRDVARIGFRHIWLSTSIFVLVVCAALAAVFLFPKTYVSEGKLFLRIGRSSVSLDPTATVGQIVSLTESRERELNSALEILKSHELLEAVLKQLGPIAILEQDRSLIQPVAPDASYIDDLIWDKALIKLKKSLTYDPGKNSNVLTVSCKAKSPELAQQILEIYFAAFKTHHMQLNRTEGSFEFFDEQATKLKLKLEDAKERLRLAKNLIGVTSIDDEKRQIEQQLSSLEHSITSTQAAIAGSDSKLKVLRRAYPGIENHQVGEVSEQAVASMKGELYKLQILEGELIANLSPTHPRVVAVKDQVEQSKRLLAHQEFASEESNGLALRASAEELLRQYDAEKQTLLKLNDDEISMRSLEQEVAAIESNYIKYQDNREQARINGALEDGRISNVNISQYPTFRPKPAGLSDAVILILGVCAAVFAALVATLVSEYFDDTFQIPEDLEATLNVPVVLSVPRSRSHGFTLG